MADDPQTDNELLARFRRGDAAAFEALYRRHRAFVMRVALRFGGRDDDEALDVLQETFAWLVEQAPGLELRHRLTTLLYPVAKHLARDRRRRRERAPAALERPGQVPDAAADEAAPAYSEGIGALLTGLGPLQQEVLSLRFGEDMSLEEIARALAVPLGTVKSRLHHAMRQLRERHGDA